MSDNIPLPDDQVAYMPAEWTGFEIEAPVGAFWLGKRTWCKFHTPLEIVGQVADVTKMAGCNTFEINIGFYIPAQTWRLRLQAMEPVSVTPDHEWVADIELGFRKHGFVDDRVLNFRDINEPRHSKLSPWVDDEEDWKYWTQISVYRGIPFILRKYGKVLAHEPPRLAALIEHDRRIQGPFLASTRLGVDRASDTRSFGAFLDELCRDNFTKRETDLQEFLEGGRHPEK